jgi:phosphoribosyl 1,2-cyclic phosphate phosphodiesterase
VWFQIGEGKNTKSILIDTGPDFRQQALRAQIDKIDAVLYTHPHADHLNGCDDLRAYNFTQKSDIQVYGNAWLNQEIHERFAYVFGGKAEGGILPSLSSHLIEAGGPAIDVAGVLVQPLALPHGSKETLGYRIDDIAYVTDCSYIPSSSLEKLKGLKILILDCVRLESHKTHLHLNKSLEIVSELKPRKTFLTHLGHDFDYAKWSKKLPAGVALAYDGLKIRG